MFVLEFDFRLLWMDIDVNACGVNLKIDEVGNLCTVCNEAFVGSLDGFVEIRVAHVAAVHKEELLGTFFLCSLGCTYETANLYQFCIHLNGY